MTATVDISNSTAVASQQQYTSRKTVSHRSSLTNSMLVQSPVILEFSESSQLREEPITPGLVWDSDASSEASYSPHLKSVFEDWEDSGYYWMSPVDLDEDGSQVINIQPGSAYYYPSTPARPFGYSPFSDPAFPDNFSSYDNASKEVSWERQNKQATTPQAGAVIIVEPKDLLDACGAISVQTDLCSSKYDEFVSWSIEKSVPDVPVDLSHFDEDGIEAFSCVTPIATRGACVSIS